MMGSVQHIANTPRVEFSADLAEAVIAAATDVLTSERRSSFKAEDLSVEAIWARRDNNSAFAQMKRAPTLALVETSRLAHDDAPDPVLWPTPKEAEGAQPNSGAVTAATAGTATVEEVAPGMVAARLGETGEMMGVMATTTAAGVATLVAAGASGHVMAQSATKGEPRPDPTGAAAAARKQAREDRETAHEGLQHGTARPPPPARLRVRTRTAAR